MVVVFLRRDRWVQNGVLWMVREVASVKREVPCGEWRLLAEGWAGGGGAHYRHSPKGAQKSY